MTLTRRATFALAFGATAMAALPVTAASDPIYSTFFGGAIKGYDPVAYFTQGQPVEGTDDFQSEWMDTTWSFASAENKALFEANPEAYAPQYGGYCAWAVSQGYTASIDPDSWRIVDGKLYLNYSSDIQQRWEQDIPGNISLANNNWPNVLE